MARVNSRRIAPAVEQEPFDFWKRVQEIDMFFEGRSPEHKTMRRVVQKLEKAGIPYAVMGAMAVNAHRHERTTRDVDILVTVEGFDRFCKLYVPKAYDRVPRRPHRVLDRRYQRTIDFLITGNFPGSGDPGPITFPDPTQVSETIQNAQVVNLETLIQLKLAARRHYDFGDVANLIRVHNLDESFLSKLHPSLHQDFIECLEEKRRDDLYEARQVERADEMRRKKRYGSKND